VLDATLTLWQLPKIMRRQGPTPDMIKSELVIKLTEQNPHLYQRDIEQVANAILDTISDALAQGGRVELRGFGTFTVKKREARAGRNPRTGDAVSISEKVVPVFRTGKEMRQRLNPASPKRAKKKSGAAATNVRGLVNA
jgi:integration host factor subunit beta